MRIIYDDMLIKHLLQLNKEIQERHRIYRTFGRAQSALIKRNELINVFYESMRQVDGNVINVPRDMKKNEKKVDAYVSLFNSVIKEAAKERELQRQLRKVR